MTLDDVDSRIVALLLDNARASYSEIGAQVGLSAPAVKRRVDRLVASGAVKGFAALVEPSSLGWTTEAYVEIYCSGRTTPDEIRRALSRYPQVVAACTVSGEADALLHVLASDVGHFEQVLERISAEPFVARTKSVIVLSRLFSRMGVGAE